jgi:hypothetical protein
MCARSLSVAFENVSRFWDRQDKKPSNSPFADIRAFTIADIRPLMRRYLRSCNAAGGAWVITSRGAELVPVAAGPMGGKAGAMLASPVPYHG